MPATIIEVALNGPWTRRLQPKIPLSPAEIISEAIVCCKAGASVVHFHAYDVTSGEQTTNLDVVEGIVDGIRSEVDAIIYPAIRYMSNAEAITPQAGMNRYSHLAKLASLGKIDWLIVDPGSTNLVMADDVDLRNAVVDINTPAAIQHGLNVAAEHSINPTMAIYDPGYLRLANLLVSKIKRLKTPVFRFMFSEQLTFGFPPRQYGLDAFLALYDDLGISAPWMIAGLGTDIMQLLPSAVQNGGHLRVGLEDYLLNAEADNLSLVEAAAQAVHQAGGNVASSRDARLILSR
jgi:3-keto-5-aminohexanoate cleavage enzyme